MKKYKVIKEFGCANKGDIFYENDEEKEFEMCVESVCDDIDSIRSMSISPAILDTLVDSGYLEDVTEEDESEDTAEVNTDEEESEECDKIEKVLKLINDLKQEYATDYKALIDEYNEGNVPACIKTEADTVYFNLNKVLDKITEVIDE